MKNLRTLAGNCGEKPRDPIDKKPPNPVGTEEENQRIVDNLLVKNLPIQMESWGGKPKDR